MIGFRVVIRMHRKACTTHQVQVYIIDTNNNNNLCPLEWWRANGRNYSNVERVAQEWLAVPETYSPTEHVLSMCGLVDSF